jgi:hypothetical protein
MKAKIYNFFSLTHPGFYRLPSAELCLSLFEERGEDTARWLACLTDRQGVSKLKYDKKNFTLLYIHLFN